MHQPHLLDVLFQGPGEDIVQGNSFELNKVTAGEGRSILRLEAPSSRWKEEQR